MSTYTTYTLKSSDFIKKFPKDLNNPSCVESLFKCRQVWDEWYDHREDLIKVSKANPTSLIIVECHSEYDEYWKIYLLNGIIKEVKGEVVYPEVDLMLLYQDAEKLNE